MITNKETKENGNLPIFSVSDSNVNTKPKVIKNCDTCSTIKGGSFYGICAHCNSKYSNWTPIIDR